MKRWENQQQNGEDVKYNEEKLTCILCKVDKITHRMSTSTFDLVRVFLRLFSLTCEKVLKSDHHILTSWSTHIKTLSRWVYRPTKLANEKYHHRTAWSHRESLYIHSHNRNQFVFLWSNKTTSSLGTDCRNLKQILKETICSKIFMEALFITGESSNGPRGAKNLWHRNTTEHFNTPCNDEFMTCVWCV